MYRNGWGLCLSGPSTFMMLRNHHFPSANILNGVYVCVLRSFLERLIIHAMKILLFIESILWEELFIFRYGKISMVMSMN